MLWLYAESTALYPPIYLYANDKNNEATQRYVHARVLEAEWIQHKLKRNIPIYLYSKIEYATNFLEINETSENFYSTVCCCFALLSVSFACLQRPKSLGRHLQHPELSCGNGHSRGCYLVFFR